MKKVYFDILNIENYTINQFFSGTTLRARKREKKALLFGIHSAITATFRNEIFDRF